MLLALTFVCPVLGLGSHMHTCESLWLPRQLLSQLGAPLEWSALSHLFLSQPFPSESISPQRQCVHGGCGP